jgi:hypothetical protein
MTILFRIEAQGHGASEFFRWAWQNLRTMPKHYNSTLQSAHNRSSNHREEILASDRCGCFYCRQTFPPSEIEEWVDERDGIGTTALCPRCGIDSVIGSRSGLPLTWEFLREMHEYWFT